MTTNNYYTRRTCAIHGDWVTTNGFPIACPICAEKKETIDSVTADRDRLRELLREAKRILEDPDELYDAFLTRIDAALKGDRE